MKKNKNFSTAFLGYIADGNKNELVFKLVSSIPFEMVIGDVLSLPYIVYHMKMADNTNKNLIVCQMMNGYAFYNNNKYQYRYTENQER